MTSKYSGFRQKLLNGDLLVGTFLKTPSPISAEVLGLTDLDAVCIDIEHAPFGRLETDLCIAALRAADMPCIVRVPSDSPHDIRHALDSGASGILVPHVVSGEQAAAVVKAAHFGDGGRGFAGSSRSAGYTTKSMQEHLDDSRAETTVIVQIEDIAALDKVGEIAAAGVDAIFIGRIDLAVAMGKGAKDDAVVEKVRDICERAREVGTTVGMFTPDMNELGDWVNAGASLYLLSSDQSMMLSGAASLRSKFDEQASS